ncbi:DUF5305 domain-containing protein [Halocalculus aciditolerans]|uniref:DUF5305 domain-containing protein n=1 Tax=Halocalculus aciditolerans TaxID=1383812 RepID=A0A830FLP0_9EURY|nr:DUF5305 domain-containing protein [Halocalculus aciditolerans]GGL58581.1 hypothetical protein GCM10009039_16030 [Halocalculus aciditolerans]
MSRLPLSLRTFLDEYFAVLLIVCLVVVGGGVYLGATAATAEETRVETQQVANWTGDAEYEQSAVVENGTSVFAEGTRLSNRSLYFTRVSPVLDGEYTFRQSGGDEPARVSVELSLVERSVESGSSEGGQQTVYWQRVRSLASRNVTLAAGEPVTVGFSVDVPQEEQRIRQIREELGASPGEAQVFVVASTTVQASVAGEPVTKTRRDRLVVRPGSNVYRVSADVAPADSETVTRTVTVPVEPSFTSVAVPFVAAVLALAGAVGLVVARRRGALTVSEAEREAEALRAAREDYDDWISTGTVPDVERSTVRVDSLEDLVDVAIDSDRRVIETRGGERYVVLVDDLAYVYEPARRPEDAAAAAVKGTGSEASSSESER